MGVGVRCGGCHVSGLTRVGVDMSGARVVRSQAATRAFRGLELAAKKERLQQMSSELARAGLQTPAAAEPSQWT